MTEMIERVAKAIWALNEDTDCRNYDELNPAAKALANEWARAAIAVMREPTEAMLSAGYGNVPYDRPAASVWHDMIEEALKETE